MRIALSCLWALALLAVSSLVHGADLSLMPVSVHLDRQRDRATVQVLNNGSAPVTLQADAIAWARADGVDSDGPTDALIVSPPLFTVPPGQTQIVRVGLRRAATSPAEGTYRMVLREVPPPRDDADQRVSGQVRVLVALRVPVYVAPVVVRRDERWLARRDAQGNVVAQVTNAGNVHLKVGSLRLREGDADQPVLAEQPVGTVLFPGEARSFQLRPRTPLAGTPLTLEVMTDRGMEHVALDLASR
jgi:fimbrial chaperone protein